MSSDFPDFTLREAHIQAPKNPRAMAAQVELKINHTNGSSCQGQAQMTASQQFQGFSHSWLLFWNSLFHASLSYTFVSGIFTG